MTDEAEYRKQMEILMADLKKARAENDHETGAFVLWQIFEINMARNKTRPPPTREQLKMFEDMIREKPITATEEQFRWFHDELNRKFGGPSLNDGGDEVRKRWERP